jgi:hypothetical protein
MGRSIQNSANVLLAHLYGLPREPSGFVEGAEIAAATPLEVAEINDAVAILERAGYIETQNYLGTHPYEFGRVAITALGRFEFEKARDEAEAVPGASTARGIDTSRTLPSSPAGSPYGFSDEHWESVTLKRRDPATLHVVLGYQFKSSYYVSPQLVGNLQRMFERALEHRNNLPAVDPAALAFKNLAAGYGEHLFNEIAADIIGADIAVFDVSDLNPNVMIEVGVALTWGTRVLLIKDHTASKPPSDISGHTWVDYQDSGAMVADPEHDAKLVRMVERALGKKLRA